VLEIEVTADGEPVILFATHLGSRWDIPQPVDEIPIVLDILRGAGERPHLLAGDFNALRPGDPVGAPPDGVEKRGDAVDGAARPALRPLLAAGYRDCYRAMHNDSPGFTYPADRPWLRLDYIFASPVMAHNLIACDVVRGTAAARASDHLPVRATFRLPSAAPRSALYVAGEG
jgi:endonuclease/exonuclease/phosphatase family metal-dependent hydrolase